MPERSPSPAPEEVMEVMAQIAANQRAYEKTRGLRKQYRLALENERLFAQIGVKFTAMIMQRPPRGLAQRIIWWWLNRG